MFTIYEIELEVPQSKRWPEMFICWKWGGWS